MKSIFLVGNSDQNETMVSNSGRGGAITLLPGFRDDCIAGIVSKPIGSLRRKGERRLRGTHEIVNIIAGRLKPARGPWRRRSPRCRRA